MLTHEAAQDPVLVDWFENEAQHVASIEHPNVVTLYRAGREEDGRPFLVAEYVEGASLADVLKQYGPLPPELAAFIGAQVAAGLSAAHNAGILHRDLKPANVLLGSDGSVKLTDFGLATQLEPEPGQVNFSVRGTPGYLAPEIVLGEEAGAPADLFALGATIVEALTGHVAFPAKNVQEALDTAIHHDPVPSLRADPRVPPSLANIVASLLDRNPNKRTTASDASKDFASSAILPATDNQPIEPETLAAFLDRPSEYEMLRPVVDLHVADRPSTITATVVPSAKKRDFWRVRGIRVASLVTSVVLAAAITAFALISTQQTSSNSNGFLAGTEEDDSLGVEFLTEPFPIGQGASEPDPLAEESQIPIENTSPEAIQPSPIDQEINQATGSTANPPEQSPISEPDPRGVTAVGSLSISVQPWAEVFVDGRKVGEGARIDVQELAAGTHQVSLRNPEFPNVSSSIEIREGGEQTLAVSLWEHVARITLQVNPWASVSVDGLSIGDVPPERTVILRPGPHTIELTHPQLGTWSGTIRAVAGDRRSLPYNLTQLLGDSGD